MTLALKPLNVLIKVDMCVKNFKNQTREYCRFGNFQDGLFSRNFAHAKFRENEAL